MQITKSQILDLLAQKMKKEDIAQRLGLTMPEYRKALKVFNIVSRVKSRKIEFVDDTVTSTETATVPATV